MVSMDLSSDVRMFEPSSSPFLTFSIERILAPDFGPNKFLDAAKLQTRAGNRLSFGGVESDLCSLLRSIEAKSSGGFPGHEWSPRSDEFSKLSSRGGPLSPVSSCSSCEEENAKPMENRRSKRQLSFGDAEGIDLSRADVKPFGGMVFCDPSLPSFRLSPHSEGESPLYQKPKRTRDEPKSHFVARSQKGFERWFRPTDDIGVTQRHGDDSRKATDSKRSLKLLNSFNTTSDEDTHAIARTCTILVNEPTRHSFGSVKVRPHNPTPPSHKSSLLKLQRKPRLRADSVVTIDSREMTEIEQSPKLSVEIVDMTVDGDRRRTCFVSSVDNEFARPSSGDIGSVGDETHKSSCKYPPPVKLQVKPDSGHPNLFRRDSSDSDGPSVDPDIDASPRRKELESTVDTLPRSPVSISGGEVVSPRKEQRPSSCAIEKTVGPEVLSEKEWPVWVYCSRYSARPSSGPRSRRQTKRSGGDRTTSSAAAAEEKRCRTAFSAFQLSRLRAEFASSAYLGEKRRLSLSRDLGLSEAQVKIWFQNRRAKLKKASGERNELAIRLMEHGLYNHSTSS